MSERGNDNSPGIIEKEQTHEINELEIGIFPFESSGKNQFSQQRKTFHEKSETQIHLPGKERGMTGVGSNWVEVDKLKNKLLNTEIEKEEITKQRDILRSLVEFSKGVTPAIIPSDVEPARKFANRMLRRNALTNSLNYSLNQNNSLANVSNIDGESSDSPTGKQQMLNTSMVAPGSGLPTGSSKGKRNTDFDLLKAPKKSRESSKKPSKFSHNEIAPLSTGGRIRSTTTGGFDLSKTFIDEELDLFDQATHHIPKLATQ